MFSKRHATPTRANSDTARHATLALWGNTERRNTQRWPSLPTRHATTRKYYMQARHAPTRNVKK